VASEISCRAAIPDRPGEDGRDDDLDSPVLDTPGRPSSIGFSRLRGPLRNPNAASKGTNGERTANAARSQTITTRTVSLCQIVIPSPSRNQAALTAAFSRAGASGIVSLLGSPAEEPRGESGRAEHGEESRRRVGLLRRAVWSRWPSLEERGDKGDKGEGDKGDIANSSSWPTFDGRRVASVDGG
jgi:hypothetical protein